MPVPAGASGVARQSLRGLAVERIRTAIFEGEFQPGERLNDQELQDWLGISRTPLRDALNDLARIGLVEMEAQKFTRVALPNAGLRTEVLQTIGAMFGGIVRVTVPQLSGVGKQQLMQELTAVIASLKVRDLAVAGKLSWSFVDAVIELCPNGTLVRATKDIIDGLAYQLAATRTPENTDWDALEEGFSALLEAIDAGDEVAAELAVEHAFRLSRQGTNVRAS